MADIGTVLNLFSNNSSATISKLGTIAGSVDTVLDKLDKLKGNLEKIEPIIEAMKFSDEFTNANEAIRLINGGLKIEGDLQNKIFSMANRTRSSYTDMANVVSNMGSMGVNTFDSTDELLAFTELVQKGAKIGGTSSEDQSASTAAISKAMGTDKLDEDGFAAIMDTAPAITEAISKYTGKSYEELYELATQGRISADILKNSMFVAGDEINEKFALIPITFEDTWNRIKTGAYQAIAPIIVLINNMLKSADFNNIVNTIIFGISLLSKVVSSFIGFFMSEWPLIKSVLMSIGLYLTATLLPAFISAGISAIFIGVMVAAAWMMAHAPLVLIIATIAMLIYGLLEAGVTVSDVFGGIGGIIGVVVASIINLFIDLVNAIISVAQGIINPFINIANFLGNIFKNPISTIIYSFQGMIDANLAALEKMASAIDFIFGSKLADTVSNWRENLKQKADDAVAKYASEETYETKINKLDLKTEDLGLKYIDYGDAFNTGKTMGENIFNSLDDKLAGATKKFKGIEFGGFGVELDGISDQLTGNAPKGFDDLGTSNNPISTTSVDENKVNIADEDLKYLRDIAERDYINKLSTATLAPNISVQFGDVHETADADKVAKRVQTIMQEEIAMMSEGVYAYA